MNVCCPYNGVTLVCFLERKTLVHDHRLFLNPNLGELYCPSKQADKGQRSLGSSPYSGYKARPAFLAKWRGRVKFVTKYHRPRWLVVGQSMKQSENDFGLPIILQTGETYTTTSTFDFSSTTITWHAMHVLVKTTHLPGPECAMLTHASNFPETDYPSTP